MDGGIGLRHGVRIARTEWMRTRRQLARSSVVRAVIALFIIGTLVIATSIAYGFGAAFRSAAITLPVGAIRSLTTAVFLTLLIGFVQQTSRLLERLNINHLLTTVPARAVIIGVVLTVSGRAAIRVFLTASSIAIGFSLGMRAPLGIATVIIAVVGFLSLSVLSAVALSFAVDFLTTRSPRFRRYKTAFVVVAFSLLSIGMAVVIAGQVSIDLVWKWLAAAPTAWFVDLALVGVPRTSPKFFQSVGALGLVGIGIPVLVAATTALAERVWETEPISATTTHRSHSLVGEGRVGLVFDSRISQPTLTIARKRWLQERRIPRSLFMSGYLLVLLLGVTFPIFVAGEVPGISLVFLAFICAGTTGLAFGSDPIGTEYPSLSMTLTTVSGKQFVRGTLLSGIVTGIPITAGAILFLALWSPYGVVETLLFVVAGVGLCVCSVTIAVALGMRSPYSDIIPVPLPLSSATIYSEVGAGGFIRMGIMLGLLGIVCLPIFSSYLMAFFDLVSVGGIPTTAIRIGSLVLTTALATSVSALAYRRAVRLYDRYTLS
ncbi:hypothetical protein [Halocatena halophila]|uniref:hypothetical protein n=1 Tax=Halocatena halophila TaxID=2814576 RepID=UPI002ED02E4C